MSRRLEVFLHDRPVGYLSRTSIGGVEFRLLDSYRELVPRPVLGQKFEDNLDKVYRNRRGHGLPDFFANLIPEGRLRDIIQKASGLETGNDLALLAFVGQDLPGAVTVREIDEHGEELSPYAHSASSSEEEGTAEGEGLRFSLAGMQLKFSMLLEEDKLTLPARDRSGEWIAKFDSPTFPHLPENEFSILQWARAASFDVPECHLRRVSDVVGLPRHYVPSRTRVLAIRRYDRLAGEQRVHQEDLAQVVGLPPSKRYDLVTYDTMARLIQRIIDELAVDEFIRRLVFVIATGNSDAHLKNWSLIYSDMIRAAWSPLYDQVATIAWEEPQRALSLKLAGVKHFGRIDRSALERFAANTLRDSREVLQLVDETLATLRATWREIAADLPLPKSHKNAIREHWRTVPLLRAAGPLE